eukprot:11207233-Lingulodinium_polyedra.AAC.1
MRSSCWASGNDETAVKSRAPLPLSSLVSASVSASDSPVKYTVSLTTDSRVGQGSTHWVSAAQGMP